MLYRTRLICCFCVWLIGAGCGDGNPLASIHFNAQALAPAKFLVSGTQARMVGTIDTSTPAVVSDLLTQHPEVETIVLDTIPGADNTVSTFTAARLIRAHGLKTHVSSNGVIASGGTDLFMAGIIRTVDPGARIGVHSWITEDGQGNSIPGASLPRDDARHKMFLVYYAEMGIPDDFYWFAINAAPPTSVHWMTAGELQRFDVLKSPPVN